jgi:hypothetical protein
MLIQLESCFHRPRACAANVSVGDLIKGHLEGIRQRCSPSAVEAVASKNADENEDNAQRQTIILFDVYALLCYCLGRRELKEVVCCSQFECFGG